MAVDQVLKSGPERLNLERTVQPDRQRHVEETTGWVQLLHQPKTLLPKGEGQGLGTGDLAKGRSLVRWLGSGLVA